MHIHVTVNDTQHDDEVEPRLLLTHYLRDVVGLTGTNIGCDTSSCGACTVHLDGEAVKSCTVLAVQADGSAVTTIEGLAQDGELHPMQEAFRQCHALQCGYCTPGMVMAAVSLLEENPDANEHEVRIGLVRVGVFFEATPQPSPSPECSSRIGGRGIAGTPPASDTSPSWARPSIVVTALRACTARDLQLPPRHRRSAQQ